MKTIFRDENLLLFEPYDGVEYIHSILQNVGYYPDFKSLEARRNGLRVINKLFELDLIEIHHWGKYENELKSKDISIFEKMMYIQELWFIGAGFEDFYDMPMFRYKGWYLKELEKLGMTNTTDWKDFVKNKIGNLENWIKNIKMS